MKIPIAFFAVDVKVRPTGALDIREMFKERFAPSVPAPAPQFFLVMRIYPETRRPNSRAILKARFIDPDGKTMGTMDINFDIVDTVPEFMDSVDWAVPLPGIVFPKYGRYVLEIAFAEKVLAEAELEIARLDQMTSRASAGSQG